MQQKKNGGFYPLQLWGSGSRVGVRVENFWEGNSYSTVQTLLL